MRAFVVAGKKGRTRIRREYVPWRIYKIQPLAAKFTIGVNSNNLASSRPSPMKHGAKSWFNTKRIGGIEKFDRADYIEKLLRWTM